MKNILPRLATCGVVVLAFILGWFAWEHYTRAPWTRDARVRADVVTLSADVSGRIVRLAVQDNQHVEKGHVAAVEIDPARYTLAVKNTPSAVRGSGESFAGALSQAAITGQRIIAQAERQSGRASTAHAERNASADLWRGMGKKPARRCLGGSGRDLLRNQANLILAQANVQLAIAALTQSGTGLLQRTRVESLRHRFCHQPADPSGRLCHCRRPTVGTGGQPVVLCQRIL